jgi:UDP-2,4-diacetamido-2,4,6-trideoxy-beta-L-altropyranose hydrolase
MSKLILIRTDASYAIGSGHVMRCLSLAEELSNNGATVEFVTRNHKGNINKQINIKGFKVNLLPRPIKATSKESLNRYNQYLGVTQDIDADETIQIITEKKLDWIIVDHYALDCQWEKKLRLHTNNLMVIDDMANRSHDCDILLDQNYIKDLSRYDQFLAPDVIKLLGPKYALLRKEFVEKIKSSRQKKRTIKKVFVFFGGSDCNNLTSVAIKALSSDNLKHLSTDVVIGSNNINHEKIKLEVDKYPNMKLHTQISNISYLMEKADIAFGAGGTTTLERIALGLPSIVVTIAKNQIETIRDLDQDNYIKWIGNAEQVNDKMIYNILVGIIKNTEQLNKQSVKCKELVDGQGAKVISRLLISGPDQESFVVGRPLESDALLYWHWVNEKKVRENAFNQEFIDWKEHKKWFDRNLNNPNVIFLLIKSDCGPVGQVRFDRTGLNYTISYSLAKQFRGFSLGKVLLKKAIDYLKKDLSFTFFTLIAEVKDGNISSKKIFEDLGFKKKGALGKSVFQLEFFPIA